MTGKRLSIKRSRQFFGALASVVLTQFPNPERNGCPGTPTLRAIATKTISMRDGAIQHVGKCSPCFGELTEMRRDLYRRKVLRTAGTATALVIVTILVGYFGFLRPDTRAQQEATQTRESAAPSTSPQSTRAESVPPRPQLEYQTALLDLKNASASRAVEPSGSKSLQPVQMPRGLLTLTVHLPIGSEEGSYEMEIRKPNQPAIRSATAYARIERGITKLVTNIDTSSIQPGEYEVAWRLIDFNWRYYPILIR
jgi:hypothetical protein